MTTNTTRENEKTTIYLNPVIKKGVQYYALVNDTSLSQIINDELVRYLEDMADISAANKSYNDGEQPIPFKEALKELGVTMHEIRGSI
jgi:hypothetical protein